MSCGTLSVATASDSATTDSDGTRTRRPFKLAAPSNWACWLGALCSIASSTAVICLTYAVASELDPKSFFRPSANAPGSDHSGSAPAAPSSSCSDSVSRGVHSCDRHAWCVELQQAAVISYSSLVALMNSSAASRPALFLALDYRYFDDCHIPGSVNLWGTLISCETTAIAKANAGEINLDQLVETAQQRSGGGGYIGRPFPALLDRATAGWTLVFYCANPS